ncbi:hypothetical protein BsWGS_01873 [Bradybaena similaris]
MGDDFKIYFVTPDKNAENNKTLGEAFEALNKTEYNFKPEWVTSQECLLADSKGKQIYIFDPFEGEAFEHIKKCGYRIFGPRCILANHLHGIDLPKSKKQPVYNVAMKDVKICCTSLDGQLRDEITEKVCLMAGQVDRNLTADVTHLIAGEVGSNKYLVAVANGKQVMVKDWVFKVWELSQERHVLATDEIFQKYTCPPFMGVTVVVSGFKARERNQLRDFVIRGGGKYSGELRLNECTHLIVKEPQGAKYEAAKNWHIKIVTDRWLFDCMDKGRYLDTKPYQFSTNPQPQTVQTSTPERKSAVYPSISDISAISHSGLNTSQQHVDETTDMTSCTRFSDQFSAAGRRNTLAETKMGNTLLEADVTTSSADVFLDGCRIYLSGIKPAVQEKLRKIITAGCGLRCMEINDNITHVVIGEVVASDILVLNGLTECPHVVTADWLFECFRLNTHISEEKYMRSDLGLKLPSKYRCTTDSVEGSNSTLKGSTNKVEKDKKKNDRLQDVHAFEMDAPSDMEMAELLSQYMEPKEASKPDPVVKVVTPVLPMGGSSSLQDVTLKPQEDLEEDALTQDPNGICEEDIAGHGIFHKLKFVILGFDEEEMVQLTLLIKDKGGSVLACGKTRQVADIAIVPLMGFPVDVTVSEILTNAWLQMCMEVDELLSYDGWLSRPIELPETEPLAGCCLCVSGYAGVERECIMHLAQSLGANCQDHFSRKARKDLQANTHLVVNYPSGSKYEAAKKWQIPAVGREWISACINSGQRVPEEEYLIDVLEEKRLQTAPADPVPIRMLNSSTTSLPTPKANDVRLADDVFCERRDTSIDKGENHVGGKLILPQEVANIKVTEDRIQCEAINKELPAEEPADKQCLDRVPSSSAESSDPVNKNVIDVNPMAEIQHHLLTPSLSNSKNRSSGRKSACRPNQSENITAGCLKTPVDIRRQKWGHLSYVESPASTSTPQGLIPGGGGETPGTFMQPNFKPKFNLAGVFDTPDAAPDLNKSTPLGETFRRQITKAVQNVTNQNAASVERTEGDMPVSQSQQEYLAPLHGVVIAVAKKLGHNQEQYNNIVVELGGNYSWHNGPHVTHFVFQGRPNDTNKEFRKARDEGKTIVSPYWLFICKEQNCRVDESLFPHNYNPHFSLTMTPSSKTTPSRSSRTALRNHGQPEASAKSVASAGKTPNRKIPVLNLQKVAGKDSEKRSPQAAASDETTSPTDHSDARKDISHPARTSGEDCTEDENASDEEPGGRGKNKEIKEALSKTLRNIVAEASRPERSVKKKAKVSRLSGQLTTSDGNTSQESLPRTGNTGRSSKEAIKDAEPKEIIAVPELPHSEKVTWGDPTEDILKARLAQQLELVQGPSQCTEEMLAAMVLPGEESFGQAACVSRVKSGNKNFTDDRSPTPEAPSLAFPIAKPSSTVLSPQPIELISEESSESRMSATDNKTRVFLVSGLQIQERVDYSALVEQLGGKTIEKQHFDPLCTHLIVNVPARNEKYLSCLASGKWVLHQSYFEACRKEGKFVKEEPHEWGSSFTQPLMQNMSSQACKLASAACKWRRKIAAMKKMHPSCAGAYDGWKVLLCLDKTKEENFQRLLEAGGAQVSVIRPPFPDNVQGTHAFVDLTKVKVSQGDLQKLLEADIHCLKPEYIPAFLTEEPPPDPSEFYPADFIALKAR